MLRATPFQTFRPHASALEKMKQHQDNKRLSPIDICCVFVCFLSFICLLFLLICLWLD